MPQNVCSHSDQYLLLPRSQILGFLTGLSFDTQVNDPEVPVDLF